MTGNSFQPHKIVTIFLMVHLALISSSGSREHPNPSHAEVLEYNPLNNPVILCMFAMDAFTPVVYDGTLSHVISNELVEYLAMLNQENSLLEKIGESDKINEMIAYITAFGKVSRAQTALEAFNAVIALSRGELDDSMKKYIAPGGRSIVFELGFTGHSMKGEIIMSETKPDNFIFNVYNSGGGIEYHPSQQYSKGRRIKYAPYVSFFAKASDLNGKLAELLFEICPVEDIQCKYFDDDKPAKAEDLYINALSTLLIQRKTEKYRDFISPQRAGSCTLSSWHAFFTAKFGNCKYKKIRLAVVIGMLQMQLSSPDFDFLNHDYSESKGFEYDFHVKEQFVNGGKQKYSACFKKHFLEASYRKDSPKRTTRRDTVLAYEQIIRWLHRQNEKILEDSTETAVNTREESARYYSLFKENIQAIETSFKAKKDKYIAEIAAENMPKRVALKFEPLFGNITESICYPEDNPIRKCFDDAVSTQPVASYYFVCTWGSIDDFIDSCDMFIKMRIANEEAFPENPLHLASYVFYLSGRIIDATGRWKRLPEYNERIKEILEAISKLGKHTSAGMGSLAPEMPASTNCLFESTMAHSRLANAYFNIWKHYYANVANAGIDTSNDIRCYEAMLNGILSVPKSPDIYLTGRERSSDGGAGDYCFYDKRGVECSDNQVRLDNVIRCENADERQGIAAELFRVAKNVIRQNLGLELEDISWANDAKEALVAALLVSTDWMNDDKDISKLTRIDGYYYKLLDMLVPFNSAIPYGGNAYRIKIKSGPSGIERLSSGFFVSPLFRGSLRFDNSVNENNEEIVPDARKYLNEPCLMDAEKYLNDPSIMISEKGRDDLYRCILDRNRLCNDKKLGEYRREMEILSEVFKAEMGGFKAKVGTEEREKSLRIMAQCFLAIKRMNASIGTAHIKDFDVNINNDAEKLRSNYEKFIKDPAPGQRDQEELEYLFIFLEAAGEEIDRSTGVVRENKIKMDITSVIKIHGIISKNLSALEKYVHRSELFSFISRFYENHTREINEFKARNGEDFDVYPYQAPELDVLLPSSSSENRLDNRVNISYFGDVANLNQWIRCKDTTFILNRHGLLCLFQEDGRNYTKHIQSSIAAKSYVMQTDLSPLFGSKEKLYFVELPDMICFCNGMQEYNFKVILRGGHEYGRIFRRADNRQYYFELINKKAFCLKEYNGNGLFRIGVHSLKERVAANNYDETCVKNLSLIDNFAQGTSVLTLLEDGGDMDSFYFIPLYNRDDDAKCNCFIHCDEAHHIYSLHFEDRKHRILDIRADDAGSATVENRKYYGLPVLFVRPDNGIEDANDERVFMVCPTNLIQDNQPDCGKLNTAKLMFIECNSNFTPIARDGLQRAVLFRMYLESKMYIEALECLLQINLFSTNLESIGDVFVVLGRAARYNTHRDIEASFFRAAAGYMIEMYHVCLTSNIAKPSWFICEYRKLESIYSMLPGYLRCLSRSLIDFQNLQFSKIFMYQSGSLNIFKNNKDTFRGELEKSLKAKIVTMLLEDGARGLHSQMSQELVGWVQRDLAGGKSSSNEMPEFMKNLKTPESLKSYCLTGFIKSFYDEDIFKDLINPGVLLNDPESDILYVSTKREYLKFKSKALYNELYNAAKDYLTSASAGPDANNVLDASDENMVVKNALISYWEKEIAKIHDPLLLSEEEVIDSFIAVKYDNRYNRKANILFRKDLDLEAGEGAGIGLAEIVAQAEYDAIDKSKNMKFSMDSLLKDGDDFLRKKLSQRILLGMNTDELKKYFRAKDPESLYRAIWRRFIEENQGRSETVREFTTPHKRTVTMIDKIMILLCGHAEKATNVGKKDEEALRHIIDQLEKGETAVQQKSGGICTHKVVMPCLALYATHRLQKIPVIVLRKYAIEQNTMILQEALRRAFGKSVFRLAMAQDCTFHSRNRLFAVLILLRKIRDAGDVVICAPEDIRSFQIVQEELGNDRASYKVELKLIAEILRTIKNESLGIMSDIEDDLSTAFNRIVRLGA